MNLVQDFLMRKLQPFVQLNLKYRCKIGYFRRRKSWKTHAEKHVQTNSHSLFTQQDITVKRSRDRFTFSSEQINKLLSIADIKMQAMMWLGLNCGFGCTDCAFLKWTDLDLINARVILPRRKTGIYRDLPLWPETVKSLKKVKREGSLVFYTSYYVRKRN